MKNNWFWTAVTVLAISISCEKVNEPEESELVRISTPELKIVNYDESSFVVEWNAVENAGSYAYILGDSYEMTISDTRLQMKNLETASYVLKVKAVSNVPQLADSEYAEIQIDLGHNTGPEVEQWLGTWTATFSQTLKWNLADGAEEEVALLDEEMEVELVIAENLDEENGVTITGWYPPEPETPAYGVVMLDGTLVLHQAIAVGESVADGIPTWMSFCSAGGEFGFVTGPDVSPYSLKISEDGKATGTAYEGLLINGLKFKVVNLGIYYDAGNGKIRIPEHGETYLLPAGDARMVYKSSI